MSISCQSCVINAYSLSISLSTLPVVSGSPSLSLNPSSRVFWILNCLHRYPVSYSVNVVNVIWTRWKVALSNITRRMFMDNFDLVIDVMWSELHVFKSVGKTWDLLSCTLLENCHVCSFVSRTRQYLKDHSLTFHAFSDSSYAWRSLTHCILPFFFGSCKISLSFWGLKVGRI